MCLLTGTMAVTVVLDVKLCKTQQAPALLVFHVKVDVVQHSLSAPCCGRHHPAVMHTMARAQKLPSQLVSAGDMYVSAIAMTNGSKLNFYAIFIAFLTAPFLPQRDPLTYWANFAVFVSLPPSFCYWILPFLPSGSTTALSHCLMEIY